MPQVLEPDICVIGAGSGGLSVAAGAAQMGARVVLIEMGRMGGDCLNTGCVPSKSLIAAARMAATAREAARFGVSLGRPKVDFARVRDHIRDVIAQIAPHDSIERFTGLGVTGIQAKARFTGPREVEAGNTLVRARRFVVAAGSSPALPPIPGLAELPFLTNETVFDLAQRPDRLLVIGGGPIGCELAQAFRRLGSEVAVASLAFLERDDPEMAAVVLDCLRAEGVQMTEGVKIAAAAHDGKAFTLTLERTDGSRENLTGSHLLVATGRRPNTDGLGLEAAGIAFDKRGIAVDRRLRTTNRRVFAIGDITGRAQFTHMAGHDAGIVIRNILFRLPAKAEDRNIPWVTFTDPELAHVGLTEAAARQAGHKVTVLRSEFADNDRARAERRQEGGIKIVAGKGGRLLGATIVGPHAGELIVPWILALSANLKISAMAGYIAPYPTLSEVGKRAAASFFTPKLFSPLTKTLVRFLAKFG